MRRMLIAALLIAALPIAHGAAPAWAADVTEQSLMQAATNLANNTTTTTTPRTPPAWPRSMPLTAC